MSDENLPMKPEDDGIDPSKIDELEFANIPCKLELDGDIEFPEEMSSLPQRHQQIMTLRAIGHSYRDIADLSGMSERNIIKIVQDLKKRGVDFNLSPHQRKQFAKQRWEVMESSALGNITDKKLKDSSAAQLATIAAIARDKVLKSEEQLEEKPQIKNITDGL